MNNPIKSMWITLAAALFMAAGMNCAGSQQTAQTTTASRPAASASAAHDELDIAIRDASDYLNDNIPKESKIVILNVESNSTNLSEYIIDELIANAVNDKKFSVVDRRQLEAIQSEQKFQMSGAVDDKDALAIGKFFGAQTIISGALREIGGRYRLTIRALAVQTAQVQGQYNRNMAISETLAGLANSGGGRLGDGYFVDTTPTTISNFATDSYTATRLSVPQVSARTSTASAPRSMEDVQRRFNQLQSDLIKVSRDARGTIISMADILFATGKADLQPTLKEGLAKIAGILIYYKDLKLVVEGHTDNTGLKEFNQKLSEDRAANVKNYLIEQGVAAARLTSVGKAFSMPIADNATREGRAMNRRVDIIIQF